MSNKIKIKRNSHVDYDASTLPSGLVYGELGFHNIDSKLFIGRITQDYATSTLADAGAVTTHLPLLTDLDVGSNAASAVSGTDLIIADTGTGATDNTHTIRLASNLTGVTTMLNSSLAVGASSSNQLDFSDSNQIHLKANNDKIATVVGTGLTMHGDHRILFAPTGTVEGDSLNTFSYIQEYGGNNLNEGDLRFQIANKTPLRLRSIGATTGQVIINDGTEDVDFYVYDDATYAQIHVDAGSSKTYIRDLEIPSGGSIVINPTLSVGQINVTTIATSGGTALIDLSSTSVLGFNKDIQIGSASDVTPKVSFRNGSNVGGYIEKDMPTGDMTIYNGLTGTNSETRTDNLIIQNAIADSDIIFKINDSVTGVATAMTIDGATNTVTIAGDLVVQGDTTTLNTENLIVEDAKIVIADNATTSLAADGAGIYIGDDTSPVQSISYSNTGTKWVLSTNTSVSGTLAVNSTSTFTGAVTASGGFTNTTFDCGTF